MRKPSARSSLTAVAATALLLSVVAAPAQSVAQSADATALARTPAALSADQVLDLRLPDVDLDEATLEDAIAQLGQFANTNIVVIWNRLHALGIDRDQPITLSVKNLRLQQVLWLILDQASSQDVRLACRIEPNLIVISSADDLGREMIVRTYDIEDLLASRLRYPTLQIGRTHDYVAGTNATVAEGAVAVTPVIGRISSGAELVGEDVLGDTYDRQGGEVDERDRYIRELLALVVTTIEPDSWAQNGGPGSVVEFKGMLVIRNSPFVHQLIGGALREP